MMSVALATYQTSSNQFKPMETLLILVLIGGVCAALSNNCEPTIEQARKHFE